MTDLHCEVTGSGPAVCLVHSAVTDLRELAERFAREIPGARLEVIHGAGHLPSLESPHDSIVSCSTF